MTYWDEKKSNRTQLELGNYPNRPCSRAEWKRVEAKCREVGTITVEDEAWLQGLCGATWFDKQACNNKPHAASKLTTKELFEEITSKYNNALKMHLSEIGEYRQPSVLENLVETWNIKHSIIWDSQYGPTISERIKDNLVQLAHVGAFDYSSLADLEVQLTAATKKFLAAISSTTVAYWDKGSESHTLVHIVTPRGTYIRANGQWRYYASGVGAAAQGPEYEPDQLERIYQSEIAKRRNNRENQAD